MEKSQRVPQPVTRLGQIEYIFRTDSHLKLQRDVDLTERFQRLATCMTKKREMILLRKLNIFAIKKRSHREDLILFLNNFKCGSTLHLKTVFAVRLAHYYFLFKYSNLSSNQECHCRYLVESHLFYRKMTGRF